MADISPELLSKLTELVKATADRSPPSQSLLAYLRVSADLLNAVAWPTAAVVCVVLFRQQLASFLGEVETIKVGSTEISRKLKQSEKEAGAGKGLSSAPSEGELRRAAEVESLAANADIRIIEQQAEELAAEYERTRHTMLPGDSRTRQMEIVVSKMRTLARAFYPLRHEFANSASPGKRLMTIAALQVDPDFDMLDWLGARLAVEKPFVGYHALVALLLAIRSPNAKAFLPTIEAALQNAEQARATLANDTDRIRTLDDAERALAILKLQ
ncbi:hypothetical protein [Bradyrhizobium liaoningense]|uniref:hypothetical protein n=1 Tax=Bradyrhizobium liaoningense TaxID=43992 RepID=UPI001BA8DBF0|nr:hypothetical protein [Bradyrhizobium liaoningense]MBR0988549.1 hypothetical protein [Bradyrhizobium liaoningense]